MTELSLTKDQLVAFFSDPSNMPPATELLGFELIDIDPHAQTVEACFKIKPEFLNPHGSVQGGIVTGFLDEVMSCAVFIATDLKAATPTLEMKTSFLRPLKSPSARAIGRIVRIGRAFAFTEGQIFNNQNELCATATATCAIRHKKITT